MLGVGGPTFTLTFDSAGAIEDYLPQTGPAGVLTATANDPTDTNSGFFGGDVVALTLNVDFSDAGLLSASSGIPFGDLLLTGFGNALDGLSVRSFLSDANTCLGAGACLLTADDMGSIADQLNASFLDGTPDAWANDHLEAPNSVSVPEPITLSLFGAGLIGAVAIRRRRKSKA